LVVSPDIQPLEASLGRFEKLRRWINRDDGRLFRVGNAELGVLEVGIYLGAIAALVFWQFWRAGWRP